MSRTSGRLLRCVRLLAGFAVAMGFGVAVVIVDVGAAEATKARRKAKEPFPEDIQFGGGFEVAPKVKFFPRTVFPPFLIAEGISGHAVVRCRINWRDTSKKRR